MARMLRKGRMCDVYVSTASYIVPSLVGRSFPCIPVIHDLIAFLPGERHDRRAKFIERLTLGRAVRGALAIATISESTKGDLLKRYPRLDALIVTPIFAGPSFDANRHPDRASEKQARPGGQTILCIATLCPRKNQLRLIHAYRSLPDALRRSARLILIGGRGWVDREIVRLAHETPGVEWQGYQSDQACREAMRASTVFAFPSLYEGFGIPVLDAMREGIPVLTSDRGSLRELAADGAYYADPVSISSIAEGLHSLLTDASLRMKLIEHGRLSARRFSWEETAKAFLGLLDRSIRT